LGSRSVCDDLRERGATIGASSLIFVEALDLRLAGWRGDCLGAEVIGGVGGLAGADEVSSESKFIIDMGFDERTGAGGGGGGGSVEEDSWLAVCECMPFGRAGSYALFGDLASLPGNGWP
jgi:hypothetical protein